jgi:hypothetical protein
MLAKQVSRKEVFEMGKENTMALLSATGNQYLLNQVAAIKQKHGAARMGKSVILRGVVDAVAQAGISLADCTDEYAVARAISAALTATKGVE